MDGGCANIFLTAIILLLQALAAEDLVATVQAACMEMGGYASLLSMPVAKRSARIELLSTTLTWSLLQIACAMQNGGGEVTFSMWANMQDMLAEPELHLHPLGVHVSMSQEGQLARWHGMPSSQLLSMYGRPGGLTDMYVMMSRMLRSHRSITLLVHHHAPLAQKPQPLGCRKQIVWSFLQGIQSEQPVC
jgi:hypothetical protein